MKSRGDLEQAYEIGCQLKGGAKDVLKDWLMEIKDRLEFEHVMKQIKLHLEREATYIEMNSSVT